MKPYHMMAAALALCSQSVLAQDMTIPITVDINANSVAWGSCPPIFSPDCKITVLHGNPALPNADALLRVPAGAKLPAHTHTSAERMILVQGELAVRYKGHAVSTLRAGNYAFGPAGMPHEATCKSTVPCDLFIAFEGPVDALAYAGTLD